MIQDKLALMARGHEIWLEQPKITEGTVEMDLVYGHNMRQDGVGDIKRLTPFVYLPDESRSTAVLSPGEARHKLSFKAEQSGYYTAIVDQGMVVISRTNEGYNIGPKCQFKDVIYSGAFHQMAKSIVTVGQAGEYEGKIMHGILEIVPHKPFCSMDEDTELKVFYEGQPLAMAEIMAVSGKEGKEMALVKTDQDGSARITVTSEGEWMFLVRHKDPSKKLDEAFDESVFVTSLVLVTK
jgi:uncharacterized GH25 family protein